MLKTKIELYEENGRPTLILIKEYDERGEAAGVTRIEGYSAVAVKEAVEAFVSGSAVIRGERERFDSGRPVDDEFRHYALKEVMQ